MLVNCKLEILEFSPSCKLKPRCNLADYKNCYNACTANPCCEEGYGIFHWIWELEFIRGAQGMYYWTLILVFFFYCYYEVCAENVPRMMLYFWTGGIYIGTLWKNGQIWCTAGYIAVEWWIQSARYTRSQKGKTQQMKVCFLLLALHMSFFFITEM